MSDGMFLSLVLVTALVCATAGFAAISMAAAIVANSLALCIFMMMFHPGA
jgi:hypothetical protein